MIRSAPDAEMRRIICELDPPTPRRPLAAGRRSDDTSPRRGDWTPSRWPESSEESWSGFRSRRCGKSAPALHVSPQPGRGRRELPSRAATHRRAGKQNLSREEDLRRHAGLIGAVASVILVLLLGIIAATIQRNRAETARRQRGIPRCGAGAGGRERWAGREVRGAGGGQSSTRARVSRKGEAAEQRRRSLRFGPDGRSGNRFRPGHERPARPARRAALAPRHAGVARGGRPERDAREHAVAGASGVAQSRRYSSRWRGPLRRVQSRWYAARLGISG